MPISLRAPPLVDSHITSPGIAVVLCQLWHAPPRWRSVFGASGSQVGGDGPRTKERPDTPDTPWETGNDMHGIAWSYLKI